MLKGHHCEQSAQLHGDEVDYQGVKPRVENELFVMGLAGRDQNLPKYQP